MGKIKSILAATVLAITLSSVYAVDRQLVEDPIVAANVMSSVNTMNSMLSVTNQIESRMGDLNASIGSSLGALGNPLLTAVQLFGRCGDPFAGLKGAQFLPGIIKDNFDFCNLTDGKKEYERHLFLPSIDQISQQHIGDIVNARKEGVKQASLLTMALANQNLQGINEMRKRVVSLSQKAESSPNMREDLRIANQLKAVIANELIHSRALQASKAVMQAMRIPAEFFPVEDPIAQNIQKPMKFEPYVSRRIELEDYYLGLMEKEADLKMELKIALFEKDLRQLTKEIEEAKK